MDLSPSGIHDKRAENQSVRPVFIPSKTEVWWPRDFCSQAPCCQIFSTLVSNWQIYAYICMHIRIYLQWYRHPFVGPMYNLRPCNSESLYEDNGLFWPYTSPLEMGKTSVAVQHLLGTWEKFFTGCMNGSQWSSIDSALGRQIQHSVACMDEAKV